MPLDCKRTTQEWGSEHVLSRCHLGVLAARHLLANNWGPGEHSTAPILQFSHSLWVFLVNRQVQFESPFHFAEMHFFFLRLMLLLSFSCFSFLIHSLCTIFHFFLPSHGSILYQPISISPQQIPNIRQQSSSGPPPLLLAPRASVPNVQIQGQRIIQQGLIRVANVPNASLLVNIPQVSTVYVAGPLRLCMSLCSLTLPPLGKARPFGKQALAVIPDVELQEELAALLRLMRVCVS